MFIHGAFVSRLCWDSWVPYFENHGYNVVSPAWPHKEGSPAEHRRRQPDPLIAGLKLDDLIEHHSKIARSFDEKPIAIGHSFGGLLTQILLNRDIVSAGVAIHSVMPQGVIPTQFSFFKATWGPLGFLSSAKKSFLFNMKQWQYAFANGQTDEEARRTYDLLVVPESKYVARGALTKAARVNFKKPHNPLLMIAGTADNIIPAGLNRSNFKKYKHKGSIADFKEFEGNNHSVLGLPNWKDTADYILNWLKENSITDTKKYDKGNLISKNGKIQEVSELKG